MAQDFPPVVKTEQLSALLQLLYSGVTNGNWQPFLQQIMELTQSNKAFVSARKAEADSPLFINYALNFEMPAEAVIYYQQRPYDDPFFIEYVRFLPAGEMIEPSAFVDINQHRESEFSVKVLQPLRCHHVLGALLLRDEEYDAFFILNRGYDDPPYSEAERQLIELIKPHVQQAMRLFTLFRDIKQQNDMLQVVLDQSDRALMVIDADATILLRNKQAEHLLTTLPYWYCSADRFYLKNNIEQLRFKQLIVQCFEQQLINQDRLYLQLNGTEMQICLSLAPLRWLQLNDNSENLCLLTIDYQKRISWGGLREEYGLTPRELELTQALHNNQKLTELANQMGISYNTLRRHLQAIFAKCRVNSQSELMLLLSRFRH